MWVTDIFDTPAERYYISPQNSVRLFATGSIPPELGNLAALESFSLAGNQLSGEVRCTGSEIFFSEFRDETEPVFFFDHILTHVSVANLRTHIHAVQIISM